LYINRCKNKRSIELHKKLRIRHVHGIGELDQA
jgi:hypothetical protein